MYLITVPKSSTALKCIVCSQLHCRDSYVITNHSVYVDCKNGTSNENFKYDMYKVEMSVNNAIINLTKKNEIFFDDEWVCYKTVHKSGNDNNMIHRGCIKRKSSFCETMEVIDATFLNILKYCDICDSDGCNGIRPLMPSFVTLSLIVVTTYYLKTANSL
ncbi:uncharacterized protein LOC126901020 [Daktulosphaira vitifoliae]|uniref:uncharacterized protein LOC126901020 n=1 Tax=Daktulosphaira vitifoliae TaxID=58002 RepID=UPI0021AA71B7|nr:uncharacterized protein LOC126901020 [Daktulosphaira vitifoliae]